MVAEKEFYHHIAVIGLGYVGLPIAHALAKKFDYVLGFDVCEERVTELHHHYDRTNEIDKEDLRQSSLQISHHKDEIAKCHFFIVTVPTPIDCNNNPDLQALYNACITIAPYLKKDSIVVFESTVYPGVSEEYCGKILEDNSNLMLGQDFTIGYSPERINPGDKKHCLENIVKIISGQDKETLNIIAYIYGKIIIAGLHHAPSIKVAEAAKAIENAQRDINIAFMNELAQIFDKAGINSKDVFAAAATKWNFLHFTPGLVGGHCIGVDPYYLKYFAEKLEYCPHLITVGREINDRIGNFIANKAIDLLQSQNKNINQCRVALLGMSFKENVPDMRNSRSYDIAEILENHVYELVCHDPYLNNGVILENLSDMDAVIIAVAHHEYKNLTSKNFENLLCTSGVIIDVKAIYHHNDFNQFKFWQF